MSVGRTTRATLPSHSHSHGSQPSGGKFVVQQHVKDPLLTDDGRKAHLKFYILMVCAEDGVSWTLYTYRGALLSISPNRWSADDLSHDTQITIHRHPQPPGETEGWAQHWPRVYEQSKAQTLEVLKRAVTTGLVKGRKGKTQVRGWGVCCGATNGATNIGGVPVLVEYCLNSCRITRTVKP